MDETSHEIFDSSASWTKLPLTRYRTAIVTAGGVIGSALLGVGSLALGLPFPLAVLVAAGGNLAASLLMTRSRLSPIRQTVDALAAMAHGDLSVRLDERAPAPAGELAARVNQLAGSMRSTIASFDESATMLASASEDLAFATGQIADTADRSAVGAGEAATAATEISRGIKAVASGSRQFGESIGDIARSAGEAARMAATAVGAAERTNEIVTRLDVSATKIGNVINMITAIAEQTNLLALNATIEAARAGTAGRGFAVVAGEVKDLARETSTATSAIVSQVESLQTDAANAAAAVTEIYQVIEKISEYQLTISAAVDEQHITTDEINRGINQIATGSDEIASDITSIAEAAQHTTEGVSDTKYASEAFAQMAADLRSKLQIFRI